MGQRADGEAMANLPRDAASRLAGIVLASGEAPLFKPGEPVRVMTRAPVGHVCRPICAANRGWSSA
jgi:hypothetical protein